MLSKRALVAAGAMRTVMHGLDEVLASGRARQFELKLVVAALVGEARWSGARAAAGGARAPLATLERLNRRACKVSFVG